MKRLILGVLVALVGMSTIGWGQMSNVPRIQSITIVEDGEAYPVMGNRDGSVQVNPSKLLKERNLQNLVRILEGYIGWPAEGASVEAIGRAIAAWGRGNAIYFNLLSPISIPPHLTLTLYPKGEGPSFLTYTQPKLWSMDVSGSSMAGSPSYWVENEESTPGDIEELYGQSGTGRGEMRQTLRNWRQ